VNGVGSAVARRLLPRSARSESVAMAEPQPSHARPGTANADGKRPQPARAWPDALKRTERAVTAANNPNGQKSVDFYAFCRIFMRVT
jgi:hypothetical protein